MRRRGAARGFQPTVAALTILKIQERFEKARPRKIGPERFGYVHFGIRDLPKEEVAHAHFAAGANQKIGVGQSGGIEMIGNRLLVRMESRKAVGADVVEHGIEGVGELRAAAVIEREN